MSDNTTPGTDVAVRSELSPELVKTFAAMAMLIPSETTDALDSIISQILSAPTWEQLADPWETTGAERLAGRVIRIDTITRRPSQFKDGIGLFLVVEGVDTRTGEAIVTTTSAMGIVAQLTRAYAAGWLPLYAEWVIAERATENGYRPQHLKFHGRPTPRDNQAG